MIEFPNSLAVYSLFTCLLLAGWVRSHIWSRGLTGQWKWLGFTGRSVIGFLTLFAAAGVAQHAIVFSTSWRLWPILLPGAFLIEGVMALARLERNIVSPRAGRTLTVLRVSSILAVLLILCQPVVVFNAVRHIQRHVVVLLDVSASMQVPDNNLSAAEKLRLSESLQLPAARRTCQLDLIASRLGEISQTLLARTDWLNALSEATPELRSRQLKQQGPAQRKALKQIGASLEEASQTLDTAAAAPFLQKAASTQISDLKRFRSQLTAEATQPLDLAIKQIDAWDNVPPTPADSITMRDALRKTATFLAGAEGRLRPIGDEVDRSFYQTLSESDRKAIDQVATLRRSELAERLLSSHATPGILEQLDADYGTQVYSFGAFPTEVKPRTLFKTSGAGPQVAPAPRQLPSTDLAGALSKISETLTPEQTAGVILLSDGRHNTASSVESIARTFGTQRIPIFPVVMGGNRTPPTDAAIATVTAPESVSTNERVSFAVDLKLDGLSGSNVTVTLFDGAIPVASNTVTPTDGAFRQQLLLSDLPKTNGLHAYSVKAASFASEVDFSNNVFSIPVRVESDSMNVLLIDGTPRWEFRFLKNLFMQRDKNVRLQYLLLHPDQIDGITGRPPRPASVAADPSECEVTLLPANEAEWMKFDVIILGDVAPDEHGPSNPRHLQHYVHNRGG